MNKKELTDLGIAEDVAEKIIVLHGKDIESHKSKLTAAQADADATKAQLAEASKQIEAFKGMDIEGVKKSADEWKVAAEKAKTDAEAQLHALKFDHALDGALTGAKAKNLKVVKALLNTNDLKLGEDGSIVGLNDQLEKVRSENDYLFESDEKPPKIITGGQSKSVISDAVVEAARKAAGLPPPK